MFNVTRPQPGPDCSKDYRSKEVVNALRAMFHEKCYLCEDKVSDPEIDHFIPHKGDEAKKFDWNNLYYSCSRCNSIKGTRKELLDCCDASINISEAIKCLCPSALDYDVIVEAQNTDIKTCNTAELLKKCYNADNTGGRGVSRASLREKIFGYYSRFITHRIILKDEDSLLHEKDAAKEHLKNMMEVSYPFSIFWRWHILSDSFLRGLFIQDND
ncbi:hypothetical protein PilKf_00871 [Pillotina sp. SPG140]